MSEEKLCYRMQPGRQGGEKQVEINKLLLYKFIFPMVEHQFQW